MGRMHKDWTSKGLERRAEDLTFDFILKPMGSQPQGGRAVLRRGGHRQVIGDGLEEASQAASILGEILECGLSRSRWALQGV